MHAVQVIVKKSGQRRPIERIIVIDESGRRPQAASGIPQVSGSWTGCQVQGGGGMYHGRRKKK